MLRTPFFKTLCTTIVIVAILHFVALNFYLYWSYWWFDILVHFLGGFWIGLSALWLIFFSGFTDKESAGFTAYFLIAIVASIIVGLGWEVFETVAKIAADPTVYWKDTLTDLALDIIGGMLAALYVYLGQKRLE